MNIKLKPWLAMALIFAIGIITGIALSVGLHPHGAHLPGTKQMEHHWLDRMNDRLHLTPDQQSKIEPLLTQAGQQIKDVHKDEIGRISHIFEATDAQISPLLTPDQQAEFAKMQQERQNKFFHHAGPWGSPSAH